MRGWWPLLLVPLTTSAEPAPFASLVEPGRTWTYDVTTTTYDIANWGSLTRPPKLTTHGVVTCTAGADGAIACDGLLEPAVAGRYEVTAEGLVRDHALVLAAKPRAFRKATRDAAMNANLVQGVRPGHASWCVFEDSTEVDPDGATREQCFGPTGVTSGELDGGGGDWRHTRYTLRATRAARVAGTR